jgi:DNA-binding NarL/FixJ family response regulator
MREILRAGARGFQLKDAIERGLLAAVHSVAGGDGYLSPADSEAVLSGYRRHVTDPLDLLSSREREVLQMSADSV